MLQYAEAVVISGVHPVLAHDKHIPLLSTPKRTLALLRKKKRSGVLAHLVPSKTLNIYLFE